MKLKKILFIWLSINFLLPFVVIQAFEIEPVYPGRDWEIKGPAQVGLDVKLGHPTAGIEGGHPGHCPGIPVGVQKGPDRQRIGIGSRACKELVYLRLA